MCVGKMVRGHKSNNRTDTRTDLKCDVQNYLQVGFQDGVLGKLISGWKT